MKKIEKKNDKLTFRVSLAGGIEIIDNRTGAFWTSRNTGWITFYKEQQFDPRDEPQPVSIPLGSPALKETETGVLVSFLNEGITPFYVEAELLLTQNGMEIHILKADTSEPFSSIEYPAHLFSFPSGEEKSYLAMPCKQGTIIPGRLDAGFMRFMHNAWANISDVNRTLSFESSSINMTWFGAQCHESGLFAHVATAEDASLHVVGNAVVDELGAVVNARRGKNPGTRICSLGPVWNSSHGKLGYTRVLQIEPVKNGYIGMAKRYREIVIKNGRYSSLKQKIEKNPEVAKLIGAVDVKIYVFTNRPNTPYFRAFSEPVLNGYSRLHTSFAQIGEMAEQLKKAGVNNALILVGGWNRMGYDREHIDMLPAAEIAGGNAGLAAAAKKVRECGYLFALHDNYQDVYLDSPSYTEEMVMKNPDGSLMLGGIWDGGLCRLVCSKEQKDLMKKTLDELLKDVPVSSYYLDTITAAPLYECYDKNHPLTRGDDKVNKNAVLDYLIERGLIPGGEGGIDWGLSRCGYFEGLPGSATGYFPGILSPGFGIAAPLFNLVYHDAVLCYWQHGQPFGREDHDNHVLHDMLNGQPSSWSLIHEQWNDLMPSIVQCSQLLGELHKATAFHEMTSHRFLTDDFAVQESEFGDGSKVTINYGITTYDDGKLKIPPKGFCLAIAGRNKVIGGFKRLAYLTEVK